MGFILYINGHESLCVSEWDPVLNRKLRDVSRFVGSLAHHRMFASRCTASVVFLSIFVEYNQYLSRPKYIPLAYISYIIICT